MAQVYDLRTSVLILNGFHIQGFGSDNETISLPDIEGLTAVRGADGKLEFHATAELGGDVVVTLLPSAPSNRLMMGWASGAADGNHRRFDGSHSRPDGSTTQMQNGGLRMWPTGPNQGKGNAGTLVYTFHYEIVRGDYDAFNVTGVPIVSLQAVTN